LSGALSGTLSLGTEALYHSDPRVCWLRTSGNLVNRGRAPRVSGLETVPVFLMERQAGFRMIGVLATVLTGSLREPTDAGSRAASKQKVLKGP